MTHPFSYQDRRVVVTGGSRGVGAALLDVLAELDAAHVTVLDLNPPGGPHHVFVETNLAEEDAVRSAIAAIDGPVDALFNNAGVADTSPSPVVFAVNYLALRTLSEQLLERMPEGGSIVNTASTAGNLWRKRKDEIDELLAIGVADSWIPAAAVVRRGCVHARAGSVQLLEGARGALHDAVVATDDPARRPDQRRRPGPDRHPPAAGLPRDHQRPDRRLEHPRDGRAPRCAARGRRDTRVPRLAGRRGRSTA